MKTYRIVRFFQGDHQRRTIVTGLSLEDAQDHCRDEETSSRTATSAAAEIRTEQFGAWFDGYEEE